MKQCLVPGTEPDELKVLLADTPRKYRDKIIISW